MSHENVIALALKGVNFLLTIEEDRENKISAIKSQMQGRKGLLFHE